MICKFTQKDLAMKVGCSAPWLCRVLSMRAEASDDLIERLHVETGIPRKTLMMGPEAKIKKMVARYIRQQRVEMAEKRDAA